MKQELGDIITGEKAIYMGSGKCLRCHTGLTTAHVERWKRVKFESFNVIKEAPDFIDGDEEYRRQCYECHTTGYDKETGTYSEEDINSWDVILNCYDLGAENLDLQLLVRNLTDNAEIIGSALDPAHSELQIPRYIEGKIPYLF